MRLTRRKTCQTRLQFKSGQNDRRNETDEHFPNADRPCTGGGLQNDMSGAHVFAKDASGDYYMIYHPADVRYERASAEEMERDIEQWTVRLMPSSSWAATSLRLTPGRRRTANQLLRILSSRFKYKPDVSRRASSPNTRGTGSFFIPRTPAAASAPCFGCPSTCPPGAGSGDRVHPGRRGTCAYCPAAGPAPPCAPGF